MDNAEELIKAYTGWMRKSRRELVQELTLLRSNHTLNDESSKLDLVKALFLAKYRLVLKGKLNIPAKPRLKNYYCSQCLTEIKMYPYEVMSAAEVWCDACKEEFEQTAPEDRIGKFSEYKR